MIEIKNKQILIDGKPQLIMCGEIHYFRLDRGDWQDRIDKLIMSGCNAVATYVPWVVHEFVEGEIDLTGKTRPEHDLQAFIDLCHENDLYFFVRPGPFIMAEMKNEGLPYWVYEKHPEIIPVGWDESQATTKTVDYLHPGFLADVKNWYRAVMEVVTPRLYPNGNVIAFQLDNEIGMLSWVSNTPDLTDFVLDDFSEWLQEKYAGDELKQRYPISFENKKQRNDAIRSPEETYSLSLMKDLGYYMRHRFAKYVAVLREYAEEFGAKDIPFVVNIHGTSHGRGFTYPIGISQLYESYTQGPGYLSGSDIYFGDLTVETFQDLYLINGFMDAVHLPDQPLTSVEFNCGDGNFGNNLSGRYDPSSADFKTRMCIAQGNRLLNYYLFAGGQNYRFDTPLDDGNDRIAFTGEHHGFAAPVGPTGKLNYTFPRMARSIQTMMAVADKIAAMDEERDNIAFAFIPDYYMTEYRYPESEKMREVVSNIEANRGSGSWESMARAMLLMGYRFSSIDIQNKSFSTEDTDVLAIPSAKYMSANIQEKLVGFMKAGGNILLFGEVPQYDMEGHPCTILADALGVKVAGERRDGTDQWLSLYTDGWVTPRAEVRTHFAQILQSESATPLLKIYGTDEMSALEAEVGKGRAVVIAAAYPCDLVFYKSIFKQLGTRAALTHDFEDHGIFSTSTSNRDGERFIHLMNLDGYDKTLRLSHNGEALFGGKELLLQSKEGVMLPINLKLNIGEIVYSTAEIMNIEEDKIEFHLTQAQDVIAIKSDRKIEESKDYSVEHTEGLTYVRSNKHAKVDSQLIVSFK
ncbi:beta-galactosidase [Pseudogracilibacillus auburnensis]|uniref:beta-galactosidase n=1 Tax=Pseudogracilibacillus auburnensis TaxID=1494959 RepID=UPI001A96C19A|nr:beta-galactosidase [Pseudogracilibacillus auburnensis]MBO1004006.1 beta-galactosidase [Pseudogracilibacillus auburnensis]